LPQQYGLGELFAQQYGLDDPLAQHVGGMPPLSQPPPEVVPPLVDHMTIKSGEGAASDEK
jgi:hypothetical protein